MSGASALATVSVTAIEGGGTVDQLQLVGGKYRIRVTSTATGSPTTWRIQGNDGDKIEYIRVENSGPQNTFLQINGATGTAGIDSVDEVSRVAGTYTVIITQFNCSGDVGSISVTGVTDSDIGGDITGGVTILARESTSLVTNLARLKCTGDLLGDVTTEFGSIQVLDIGGDIGASGSPVSIRTKFDIRTITALGAVYADIDATAFSSFGAIDHIECNGGFFGSVTAREFDDLSSTVGNPGLFVGGNLGANITLTNAMDREIIVGGSFNSGKAITLPSNGLVGQVTFNNADDSATWSGTVSIGGSSLSGPYYTNTAASLGGGSVGLATFNLHGSSCAPADGATEYVASSLLLNGICLFQCERDDIETSVDEVIVRHYGPVEWSSGTPLTVKRRSLACGGSQNWSTVTSDFSFAIQSGSGDRGVKVTYTGGSSDFWPIDYEYLIEPVAGVLKSKGVNGAPDVADYDYKFSLVADCGESFMSQYDRNHDDALCSADIVAWTLDPADLNNDSLIDEADLAVLWDVVQTHGN